MIWKISPLFKFEITGVFVNTHGLLITSILIRIMRVCRSLLESNYLNNKKYSLRFLFHLWNLKKILNTFKKKKIVIASVFLKLKTVQYSHFFVRLMESTSDFKHFQKKEDRHSQCISEINDCLTLGQTTHQKAPFQNIPRQSTC